MAGGIDWFRWHHGSVTDPKFQLVARKSESSLSDVLAVWAYLLEKASAAQFRGCFGDIDCEAVDCLFDFPEGRTDAILFQMSERKLIDDEYIVAWEKRQPKKEDETSAERKRRQREREHELKMLSCVTTEESRHVTPCHDDVTPCHDREEKSREEYISTDVDIVASKLTTGNNCPHQEILRLFAKRLPNMPQPRIWKAKRAKDLADRWKWVLSAKREDGTPYATDKESALDFFDRFFAYVAESDFLTGRNGAWTGCDLPWLVKEDKFANIISGKYDNRC